MTGNGGISATLQRTAELVSRFRIPAVDAQLQACRRLLTQDSVVEVGVFGRFKAGKSSFLNALAGRDALPVGVLPVTAALTRLRHGPRERAVIRYLDGRAAEAPLAQVADFASEAGNPQNEKQVESVLIELPSLAPYAGVEFIDTPGVGSVFAHNTQVSREWLPFAAAALVLVSVDNPLAMDDLAFIEELRRFTPRVALILAKADRLSAAELEEVAAFTRRELERRFESSLPIFPFSSRKDGAAGGADGRQSAAAQWRRALDETLLRPLAQDGERQNRAILIHKARELLASSAGYLTVAVRAAQRSDEERARIEAYVLAEDNSLRLVETELRLIARAATDKTIAAFVERLDTRAAGLRAKLREGLAANRPHWEADGNDIAQAFREWLDEALRSEMRAVSAAERPFFLAPLRETETALTRIVESSRDRMALRIEETLGVKLPKQECAVRAPEPETPDVRLGRLYDSPLAALWFLLPAWLGGAVTQRFFRRQLTWEAEKSLNRLAAQWSKLVNRAIEAARELAAQQVREQIELARRLLTQTASQAGPIGEALAELDELRARLAAEEAPMVADDGPGQRPEAKDGGNAR